MTSTPSSRDLRPKRRERLHYAANKFAKVDTGIDRYRLGMTIRAARARKGITDKQLGYLIGNPWREFITRIELGARGTTARTVIRIADALGIPRRDLLLIAYPWLLDIFGFADNMIWHYWRWETVEGRSIKKLKGWGHRLMAASAMLTRTNEIRSVYELAKSEIEKDEEK